MHGDINAEVGLDPSLVDGLLLSVVEGLLSRTDPAVEGRVEAFDDDGLLSASISFFLLMSLSLRSCLSFGVFGSAKTDSGSLRIKSMRV